MIIIFFLLQTEQANLYEQHSLEILFLVYHTFKTYTLNEATLWEFYAEIWASAWQNQQNDICAQRRLRSAWASAESDQSSLCAPWLAKDPMFLHVDSENYEQTGRMPRLIWVFAGRTGHFVGFVMLHLIGSCWLCWLQHFWWKMMSKLPYISRAALPFTTSRKTLPCPNQSCGRVWHMWEGVAHVGGCGACFKIETLSLLQNPLALLCDFLVLFCDFLVFLFFSNLCATPTPAIMVRHDQEQYW